MYYVDKEGCEKIVKMWDKKGAIVEGIEMKNVFKCQNPKCSDIYIYKFKCVCKTYRPLDPVGSEVRYFQSKDLPDPILDVNI